MILKKCLEEVGRLPPETEEGSNIEYKLVLHENDPLNPASIIRFQHYVSQLAWRLADSGECYYELGVDDSGSVKGMSLHEFERSIDVLREMCKKVGAIIKNIEKIVLNNGRIVAEVAINRTIRSPTREKEFSRKLIAVIGPSQIGKSTLISTLCCGKLDFPQGTNRLRLLKHRHEIITGKTGSPAIDYFIFDSPKWVTKNDDELFDPSDTFNAHKVIQFVDLPGDLKHLKSIFSYLTLPTLDLILFYSKKSEPKDPAWNDIESLLQFLKISSMNIYREEIDCTTGAGLEQLVTSLYSNISGPNGKRPYKTLSRSPVKFIVEHVYNGPEIGLVISGTLVSGQIFNGQKLFLHDHEISIRSIHRMRQPMESAIAGQAIAITVLNADAIPSLERGTVILDKPHSPLKSSEFLILEISNNSLKGEGLVFIDGNRYLGRISESLLVFSNPIAPLSFRFIFLKDKRACSGFIKLLSG
jgi:GTPase